MFIRSEAVGQYEYILDRWRYSGPNVKILPPNCDVLAGKLEMLVFKDGMLGAVAHVGAYVVRNPVPYVIILALTA